MKIRDIYYGKSYCNLHAFPLISTIYENRKIFEKIFENPPGREFYYFILSKAAQNRKLFLQLYVFEIKISHRFEVGFYTTYSSAGCIHSECILG